MLPACNGFFRYIAAMESKLRYTGLLACSSPRSYPLEFASATYRGWRECRRCESCIAKRVAEWALRARLEDARWHERAFVTLTYAPEFLPYGEPDSETGECLPTLVRRDAELFLKRFRRVCDREGVSRVRVFGCGEYGELHGRPHWHFGMWGVNGYSLKCREVVEQAYGPTRSRVC